MHRVSLEQVMHHPICRRFLPAAGVAHSIRVAEFAIEMALVRGVDPDMAAKAALLHDIGYGPAGATSPAARRQHPVVGAHRAKAMLLELGESPVAANAVARAVLTHSGSCPTAERHTPLERLVAEVDDLDEEPGGRHHLRQLDPAEALHRVRRLDQEIAGRLSETA